MVSLPKLVPAGKSFLALPPGLEGNVRSSFATGLTSPCQFVAVIQLVLPVPPPPSHVRVAAYTVHSVQHSGTIPTRATRARRSATLRDGFACGMTISSPLHR